MNKFSSILVWKRLHQVGSRQLVQLLAAIFNFLRNSLKIFKSKFDSQLQALQTSIPHPRIHAHFFDISNSNQKLKTNHPLPFSPHSFLNLSWDTTPTYTSVIWSTQPSLVHSISVLLPESSTRPSVVWFLTRLNVVLKPFKDWSSTRVCLLHLTVKRRWSSQLPYVSWDWSQVVNTLLSRWAFRERERSGDDEERDWKIRISRERRMERREREWSDWSWIEDIAQDSNENLWIDESCLKLGKLRRHLFTSRSPFWLLYQSSPSPSLLGILSVSLTKSDGTTKRLSTS